MGEIVQYIPVFNGNSSTTFDHLEIRNFNKLKSLPYTKFFLHSNFIWCQ